MKTQTINKEPQEKERTLCHHANILGASSNEVYRRFMDKQTKPNTSLRITLSEVTPLQNEIAHLRQ